jgi:signal transduction histidine kinase
MNDKEFTILKANLDFERQKEQIEITNEISLAEQRNLTYLIVFLLLSALLAAFIYSRNSNIQKRLNTELVSNKKALEHNEKRLNEANNLKDQLFSIVGHDLKGPIVSLRQLLDLCLEEENGDKEFKQFAPRLKSNLEYFQFTLDNLLHWGNSQLKGDNINIQKVSPKEEIDILIDFFQLLSKEKSIEISNKVDIDLAVSADLDHFRAIFRNLLSNAIKFTPENGLIEVTSTKSDAKLITISVIDSGLGMDEASIQKVLSSDKHYSTYGTKGEKGTGLGLLLCKNLITKNNGTLKINSAPSKGSQFMVTLPTMDF